MKNKKIYISNYWWNYNNYGAILTAYALQKLLNNSFLINDLNINIHKLINNKYDFSEKFKKKYLQIFDNINFSNLNELNKYSNTFISGSDQVFRICSNYGERLHHYLLDFANKNSKKIAFSASFGFDKDELLRKTTNKNLEIAKNALKSFDFISVREKSGLEICRDIMGVDAEWIIDPVFIYKDWDKLLENATLNFENKIVSYILDQEKNYKQSYKHLSKKYKYEIIETANSNISVENWLKSIKDCKFFITDSFHGMCFAIIFNKPFICIANKSRGRTRFDSICEMLGIENQCIDFLLEALERDCVFKIDYETVNKHIEEERKRGLEFLQKTLEAPIQVTQVKIDSRINYLEHRIVELEKQCNLRTQLKITIWDLWLNIFYRLPRFIQNMIHFFRGVKG